LSDFLPKISHKLDKQLPYFLSSIWQPRWASERGWGWAKASGFWIFDIFLLHF